MGGMYRECHKLLETLRARGNGLQGSTGQYVEISRIYLHNAVQQVNLQLLLTHGLLGNRVICVELCEIYLEIFNRCGWMSKTLQACGHPITCTS